MATPLEGGGAARGGESPAGADHPPEYWGSQEYSDRLEVFLQNANPSGYGAEGEVGTAEQLKALAEQTGALAAAAVAMAARPGDEPVDDVSEYTEEDPRNVWALSGRFALPSRLVDLPLLDGVGPFNVRQTWECLAQEDSDYSIGGLVDAHSTGYAVWDGGVVLADLITHPPSVLLSLSPSLSRTGAGATWTWEGKTVVELGCGGSAVPSFAAALQGAGVVFCTDGDGAVMPLLAGVIEERGKSSIPSHVDAAARMRPALLRWGEGTEAEALGGEKLPVDVVLAADVLYVLDNPGAWGALLRSLLSLAGPETLAFLTYTDRGQGKTFDRFLKRVDRDFIVAEVPTHLLHPHSQPGSVGRLEQHVGDTRVFCLARRAE